MNPVVTPPRRPPEAANPLYLLSALSMLIGCYLLNFDLIRGREELSEIASLVGVLQLYEGALLGAATYLFRSGRSLRDARTLLLLEVPFLVDATYFLAEAFEFAPVAAWGLNAAAAILAALKLWALDRALGLGYQRREVGFVAIAFAALLVLPGFFAAALRGGGLHAATLAAAWWSVAALVAFEPGGLIRPLPAPARPGLLEAPAVTQRFRLALRIGLVLSLAAHLRAAHYVYEMPFHLASLAPIVVAIAFRVLRSPTLRDAPAGRLALFGLPLLAIVLAGRAPLELTGSIGGVGLSPYRLVLLASVAHYLEAMRRLRLRAFLVFAVAAAGVAALGGSPRAMGLRVRGVGTEILELLARLWPRTLGDWGLAGIVAAFILLGAGLMLTLARNPAPLSRSGDGKGPSGWSGSAPGVK